MVYLTQMQLLKNKVIMKDLKTLLKLIKTFLQLNFMKFTSIIISINKNKENI